MRTLLLITLLLASCRSVRVNFEAPEYRENGNYITLDEILTCEVWYGDSFDSIFSAVTPCSDESMELAITDNTTFFIIRAIDGNGIMSDWSDFAIFPAADLEAESP